MNHFLSNTLKALACSAGLLWASQGAVEAQEPVAATYEQGVQRGVIRVKFKQHVNTLTLPNSLKGSTVNTNMAAFDATAARYGASNMRRVFPVDPRFEHKLVKHGLHLWYEIAIDGNQDETAAAMSFSALGDVEIAEPVHEKMLVDGYQGQEPVVLSESDGQAAVMSAGDSVAMPFDDEYLNLQWHYHNFGQAPNGEAGHDINLFKAWEITKGTSNVIVSIHDEGVDVDHEDLAANMWVNEAEANGVEGVDDDGNGYIDDVHGYSFAYDQGKIVSQSHGTHVAGTVAAVNNNNVGVAGVAGGSGNGDGVRLMSTQMLSGPYNGVAASYVYAANNGAVISQNSWGYISAGYYDQVVLDAIDYFIAEAGDYAGSPMKGGVVIFAAGNDNTSQLHYPGAYENVISVASLGPSGARAYYSNYGNWVDIAAPGGDMAAAAFDGVLSTLPDDSYGFLQGTSMACPHVSGIAGLVVSSMGGETFTSEDLKKQLLTAYTDVYAKNPDYKGYLGVGAIDTELALAVDQELAPATVTDFTFVGAAEQFILTSLTVPTDEDDVQPSSFKVYYSTSALTAENYTSASSVNLFGNFEADSTTELKVEGLVPNTVYHLAVAAVDRWGHESAISNFISGATNVGPDITADTVRISVDATLAAKDYSSVLKDFSFSNDGEGILEWSASVAHSDTRPEGEITPFDASGINYPESGALALHDAKIVSNTKTWNEQELTPYTVGDDLPNHEVEELSYYHYSNQSMSLGDGSPEISNSSATAFYSPNGGFNLTDVVTRMRVSPDADPAIIEIRQGNDLDINNSTLLYAQEVKGRSELYHLDYEVKLDEQVYISQYKYFWIVVHVPAHETHITPLIIKDSDRVSLAYNYNFMSFDMGKSWVRLYDLTNQYFGITTAVWETKAISKAPKLENYLSLHYSSNSGNLAPGATFAGKFYTYPRKVTNGTYKSWLTINSNDYDESVKRVPVYLEVTGNEADFKAEEVYDFGSIMLGETKTMELTVANYGKGNLYLTDSLVDNPDFEILYAPSVINSLSTETLIVKYTPTVAGNSNGVITLVGEDGSEHNINVFAVGAEPAEITLTATGLDYDMVNDSTATGSITIENTGAFPLKYTLPKFATEEISGLEIEHKAGYTYEKSTAPFEWEDITTTGTPLKEYFRSTGSNQYEVDLGFAFPYFGKDLTKLYISDFGIITTRTESTINTNNVTLNGTSSPNGFISPFFKQIQLVQSGDIYFKKEAGRLIVTFQDVATSRYALDYQTIQVVIEESGQIEFRYQKIDAEQAPYYFIALRGDGMRYSYDDFGISYAVSGENKEPAVEEDETTLVINTYGKDLITSSSVTNPQGTIKVGESVTVDFEVAASDLSNGAHYQNVYVYSNDPASPVKSFTVNMNVTGGEAAVVTDVTSIDMGDVFDLAEVSEQVSLTNNGFAAEDISEVSLVNDLFNVSGAGVPFTLGAKRTETFEVTPVQTSLAELFDTLRIVTASDDTLSVALHANVIASPGIAVTAPDTLVANLMTGAEAMQTVSIENTGASTLKVRAEGNALAYMEAAGLTPVEHEYVWKSNKANVDAGEVVDPTAPVWDWMDLKAYGDQLDLSEMNQISNTYAELVLPFEFDFYGEKYSTLYINRNGMMSVLPNQIQGFLGAPPRNFPADDAANGIIAPYWVNNGLASNNSKYGVYYHMTEDKVIIQWENLLTSRVGNPSNFQAVIYKDGKIKLMSKIWVASRLNGGLTGIESADGTKGHKVAYAEYFYTGKTAVEFTPVKYYEIPAGETAEFNVVMNTLGRPMGTYTDELTIVSNAPGSEEIAIPVKMTVNGTEALTAMDGSIDFGTLVAYEKDAVVKSYEQEFMIENTGNSIIDLETFAVASGNAEVALEFEVSYNMQPPRTTNAIMYYEWQGPDGTLRKDLTDFGGDPFDLTMEGGFITPGERRKMKVTVTPTPGTKVAANETINLIANGEVVGAIPLTWTAQLPPVLEVGNDEISVTANTTNAVLNEIFNISNAKGEDLLTYDMNVKYFRSEVAAPSANDVLAASLGNTPEDLGMMAASSADMGTYATDTTTLAGFHRVMSHDTDTVPATYVGLAGDVFTTATAFEVPENGFNLTHVRTWMRPAGASNSDVMVQVRVGYDLASSQLLTEEVFSTETAIGDTFGEYLTFELSTPQEFLPNEQFFVVCTYGLGVLYPQGMTEQPSVETGKYFYAIGGEWYDLNLTAGFEGYGWMVQAAEESETTVNSWLTLSATSGELDAAAEQPITATFNAAYASLKDQYAEVTVTSNDPSIDFKTVKLHLHMNQAPMFTEKPMMEVTVEENETVALPIAALDEEGNAFTFAVTSELSGAAITTSGDSSFVTFTTDYEMAGEYAMSVTATDEHGAATDYQFTVYVADVNRAPISGLVDTQEVGLDQESFTFDFSDLFVDEDGDQLKYSIEISNDSIATDIVVYGRKMSLTLLDLGTVTVTITATDGMESVSATFDVVVVEPLGIDDQLAAKLNLGNYPNPVASTTTFGYDLPFNAEVSIEVYTFQGVKLATLNQGNQSAGEHQVEFNASSLTTGMYIYILKADGKVVATGKMLKN
ncbi:S8 family serine peptidase [Limibacter armeniacum]|uniref:S8 family serine peptidase n=1 Tax=Limibacter armeniacum TaxID=466084 RepID=UPI002FE6C4C2